MRAYLFSKETMLADMETRDGTSAQQMSEKGEHMPTLTVDGDEIEVPERLIVRMAARMHRLGSPARRKAYIGKAQRRLTTDRWSQNDVATVLAAGGATATE